MVIRKRLWGFFRCAACRVLTRVKHNKCEYCGARPKKQSKIAK